MFAKCCHCPPNSPTDEKPEEKVDIELKECDWEQYMHDHPRYWHCLTPEELALIEETLGLEEKTNQL